MDNLISLYEKQLNLYGANWSRIDHEDALVAICYKITQPNGRELILKICTQVNHYFREVYFLTHLAGKLPIPRIVKVVEPEEGVWGAVLMECLAGDLLKI